jgi:hypothetical protein
MADTWALELDASALTPRRPICCVASRRSLFGREDLQLGLALVVGSSDLSGRVKGFTHATGTDDRY